MGIPLETVDTVHLKVHEGKYFSGGLYNATLADAGTATILIQTSSTEVTHIKFASSGSGNSTIQFFEGTTVSNAGTAVTMSNHNRNSTKSFSGTVTHTPTITDNGTQLNGTAFLAAGTKGDGSGDFSGFSNEFNLIKSTNYLLLVTNVSGGVSKVSVGIGCYQPSL